jgi:hypothetical protein
MTATSYAERVKSKSERSPRELCFTPFPRFVWGDRIPEDSEARNFGKGLLDQLEPFSCHFG